MRCSRCNVGKKTKSQTGFTDLPPSSSSHCLSVPRLLGNPNLDCARIITPAFSNAAAADFKKMSIFQLMRRLRWWKCLLCCYATPHSPHQVGKSVQSPFPSISILFVFLLNINLSIGDDPTCSIALEDFDGSMFLFRKAGCWRKHETPSKAGIILSE